jgi:5-methylcytosine-specific restriction protein A
MPEAPLRPCRWPGCAALVERGYCALHRPARVMQAPRAGSAARGYGAQWQRVSKAFLRENPLCVRCKTHGGLRVSEVVDHVSPHRGDPHLFWARSNWQALCKRCHDRKTAVEDGGFGRACADPRGVGRTSKLAA